MSKRVKNRKRARKIIDDDNGVKRFDSKRGAKHTRFIFTECLGWRSHSSFVRDREVPYGMGEVREELNLIRNSE